MKIKGIYLCGGLYWFRRMIDGKRHCVSLKTSKLSEAISAAAEMSRVLDTRSRDTISTVSERCLRDRIAAGRIREKTAVGTRTAVHSLLAFTGDITATSVSRDHATRFYLHLRRTMSEPGAQSYVRCLRSVWSWIVEQQHLRENPFKIKMQRLPKSPRRDFCTAAERDTLIENAPTEALRFVLFAGFHAGLRKLEIIEARPEWFNIEAGLIHVSKTPTFTPKDSDDRTVPMTKPLRAFLAGYGLREPFMLEPGIGHGVSEYRYDLSRRHTHIH